MYKLLNFLFGWDYIYWRNSIDSGIARIRTSPDGTVWFWRYKSIKVIDKIEYKNDVMWLTCQPEKYLTK